MTGSVETEGSGTGEDAVPAPRRVPQLIGYPLEKLPPIDEHGTLVLAPVEETWEALLVVVRGSFSGRTAARVARALDCAHTEPSGPIDRIGATFPGFIVSRVVAPGVLALEGQHRFSRYGLIFRLEPTKDERTLLRAETRAEFPGLKGRLYKAVVIGSRAHVRVVNRILRAVRRRAER